MPNVERSIWFTFSVEGFHSYPEATNFLKNRHRHLFKFRVEIPVAGDNREIEFIEARNKVRKFVCANYGNLEERHGCDFQHLSCEQIAWKVIMYLVAEFDIRKYKVEVSEDGENGATVTYLG